MLSYDYFPACLKAIDLISQGRTKTVACDMARITIPAFDQLVKENQQLQNLFIEAETRGSDALADALLTINVIKDPETGTPNPYAETNPQMAKVISDNIKWVLDKRHNARFGNKVQVTHNVTLDRTITDHLAAAKRRSLEGKTVDLNPEDYNVQTPTMLIENIVGDVIDAVIDEDDEDILAELLR